MRALTNHDGLLDRSNSARRAAQSAQTVQAVDSGSEPGSITDPVPSLNVAAGVLRGLRRSRSLPEDARFPARGVVQIAVTEATPRQIPNYYVMSIPPFDLGLAEGSSAPFSLFTDAVRAAAQGVASLASTRRITGPVAFFEATLGRWRLPDEVGSKLLGLEPHITQLRPILLGRSPLPSRDALERLRALMTIRRLLSGLYQNDPAAERDWLMTPTLDLNEESPLACMTDGGMEGLLLVRDYLRWRTGH